jgi:hypothetical protein
VSTEQMKLIKCKIEPEVWLDYLDKNVDPSLKNDLELHASTCIICQKNRSEIENLSFSLKHLPQMNLELPSDQKFEQIKNAVMTSIEKTQIENVVTIKRDQLKIIFGATAAAFLIVFGSVFGPSAWNQHGLSKGLVVKVQSPSDQLMVESAQNDLEVFGNVILSQQSSDDLVLDAAAEKLGGMSDQDARTQIDQLK